MGMLLITIFNMTKELLYLYSFLELVSSEDKTLSSVLHHQLEAIAAIEVGDDEFLLCFNSK